MATGRRARSAAAIGSFLLGLAGAPAGAEQYNLQASAGNDGDSHENNDDASVSASFFRAEGDGEESYHATANLDGGSFLVEAFRSGSLPFASITTRAAISISETIFIDEVPSGPITISATLGAQAAAAAAGTGFARAGASLRFPLNACQAGHSVQGSGGGLVDQSSCSWPGSSSDMFSVTLVLTPEQLDDANYQVYMDINAAAQFESVGAGFEGAARVSGSAGSLGKQRSPRGSEPIAGVVYIDIDPPTAHSYAGSGTVFPVPEPGGALLTAIGAAALAACRSSRSPWSRRRQRGPAVGRALG